MQDAAFNKLITAPVDRAWHIEFLRIMANEAHVAHHHRTYASGHEDFSACNIRACALFRRAVALDPGAETETIQCPVGHSQHICMVGENAFHQPMWHCDECHLNFTYKPEAKPFGGLSNSDFKRKLAQYIRDVAVLPESPAAAVVTLALAAAIIDPDIADEDVWASAGTLSGPSTEEGT